MFPGLSTILTAIAALAAVLGLILLAARVVRSGGFAAPMPCSDGGRLAVQEVRALDAGRRLHLVRCDGRHVLLLTGGPQDLVVGWLPDAEPAP
jgi:flagellar protein FliO/FliZ